MHIQYIYQDNTATQRLGEHLGSPPDAATLRAYFGAKGASVLYMQEAGFPIPPAFLIAAKASLAYLETGRFPEGLWAQVEAAVQSLEERSGKTFDGTATPLLLRVAAGTRQSMPGMMEALWYVGLNDATCAALAERSGDPAFFYQQYAYFIAQFAARVHEVDPEVFYAVEDALLEKHTLTAEDWQALSNTYKALYHEHTGKAFPQDPHRQLRLALRTALLSWESPRAVAYRVHEDLPHDWGVGVVLMAKVFGNLGADSGAGELISRNPVTGDNEVYGGYLPKLDIMAFGDRSTLPRDLAPLKAQNPEVYEGVLDLAQQLEQHYADMQDIEFVVEAGQLWLLWTTTAKCSARARLRVARDMVAEGLITLEEALGRVDPAEVVEALRPDLAFDAMANARLAGCLLAEGEGASPGASVGAAVFDAETARVYREEGRAYIWICDVAGPDDVPVLMYAQGVIMTASGPFANTVFLCLGSHIPVVTSASDLVLDQGARRARVGERVLREGEIISIDGATGDIFLGALPVVLPAAPLKTLVDLLQKE